MPTQYDLCLVTVGDAATAEKISSGLLKERLAACVSAVPGLRSAYWWKERIERSEEVLLLIKTRRALREDVVQFVKKHHPYSVPETVFLEMAAASQDYLDWLGANTLFTTNVPKGSARDRRKPI